MNFLVRSVTGEFSLNVEKENCQSAVLYVAASSSLPILYILQGPPLFGSHVSTISLSALFLSMTLTMLGQDEGQEQPIDPSFDRHVLSCGLKRVAQFFCLYNLNFVA